MRRSAIPVLALALLLAGCSGASDGGSSPTSSATASPTAATSASAEDVAALAAVQLNGDPGSEPTVTFDTPLTVSYPVARVVTPGSGETLTDGQAVQLQFFQVSGADGSTTGSSWGQTPQVVLLGDARLIPQLTQVLQGQQVGLRALLAVPGSPDTTVMALEVIGTQTVPARAEGTAVTPPAGLPTVTLDDSGAPSLAAAAGDPPTTLVAQPLIQGAGPAVASGQTLVVQYTGWLWDGTKFDSSWDRGAPFTVPVGMGAVIKGWDQGLVGQTVGSQVLLVVPPDLGYGNTAQGSIPAGSTLVFVIDVLAAL